MRMNSYLLTYEKAGIPAYKWFDTEKEMDDFIDRDDDVSVHEGIHIIKSETVRGFVRKDL